MDPAAYATHLRNQREILRKAKGKKGQKPMNKPSRFELEIIFAKSEPPVSGEFRFRTCFINLSYPPCTTPLADLQQITISDLRLETHHLGKVLFVRTFCRPMRIVAVQNAIEDADGNVDRLAVYNENTSLLPQEVLPKGAVFAIKEPYYKASADGGYMIRVDHPSDLIMMQPTDALVPAPLAPSVVELDKNAAEWKKDGNEALSKKNHLEALIMNTCGVAAVESDCNPLLRSDLYRNRSQVNLLLGRREMAQIDADTSILPVEMANAARYNNKAYYRAGRATYALGNFDEAKAYFVNALQLIPNDEDCLRELKRTKLRLEEEVTGFYHFSQISNSASKKHTLLDHGNFLLNTEVQKSGARGRGLFATQLIKAGELVLCEKAFSVVFQADQGKELFSMLNMNTNRGYMGPHATLVFNIIQKLRFNPIKAVQFLNLYDGGYMPKCKALQVDGATVIDTFQTVAIIEHNVFGCPEVRTADHPNQNGDQGDNNAHGAAGIWITASFINHACDGNARRAFIGDLMIVRASKDIGKGEEILMPYLEADADNSKIVERLKNTWGFTCDCHICIADKMMDAGKRQERRKLVQEVAHFLSMNKLSATSNPTKTTVANAEQLHRKLEATYDDKIFRHLPRLGLLRLGTWLCQAYGLSGMAEKATNSAIRTVRNHGFDLSVQGQSMTVNRSTGYVDHSAIDAAMYAADGYFFQNMVALGKQFEDFAKDMYILLHGEIRGFAARYGRSTN